MMLLKIAWRNILRNGRRSAIVVASIIVGILAILMYEGLATGMINQMLENQIGAHVAHLQIHQSGYLDNQLIEKTLPSRTAVRTALEQLETPVRHSERTLAFGLVSTASASFGVKIVGVVPEAEQHITLIKETIVEGRYLSGASREIVLGMKLAQRINAEIGAKVVIRASTIEGAIGSDVFRVTGLFRTPSSEFDKSSVFISLADAQALFAMGGSVSEVAVILNDTDSLTAVRNAIAAKLGPDFEVLTYKEILPILVAQVEIFEQMQYVIYIIFGIAMIFGIVNSMLMSVFERMHEFGVLKAIGMKNPRLFVMIILEAFILGFAGTIIGIALSLTLYFWNVDSGIDFSMFSESLTSWGTGAIVYPTLSAANLMRALFIIPVIAILGASYPAYRAVKLEPLSAINYI